MSKIKKIIIALGVLVCVIGGINCDYAHSGRTDANGGHKDNKNVSGLGPYHYHCGGHPAHLHDGGVCPYAGGGVSGNSTNSGVINSNNSGSSSKNNSNSSSSSSKTSSNNSSSSSKTSSNNSSSSSASNITNTMVVEKKEEVKEKVTEKVDEQIKEERKDVIKEEIKEEPQKEIKEKSEVTEVVVDSSSLELKVGDKKILTAIVKPEDAIDKIITWKSSDERIVSVSENGEIIALNEGKTSVVATSSNGKSGSVIVTVIEDKTIVTTEEIKVEESEETKSGAVENSSDDSGSGNGLVLFGAWLAAAAGGVGYALNKKGKKE